MNSARRKTGVPAKYRPTIRARLRNLVWTTALVACWPIAKVLTLLENMRTHE